MLAIIRRFSGKHEQTNEDDPREDGSGSRFVMR